MPNKFYIKSFIEKEGCIMTIVNLMVGGLIFVALGGLFLTTIRLIWGKEFPGTALIVIGILLCLFVAMGLTMEIKKYISSKISKRYISIENESISFSFNKKKFKISEIKLKNGFHSYFEPNNSLPHYVKSGTVHHISSMEISSKENKIIFYTKSKYPGREDKTKKIKTSDIDYNSWQAHEMDKEEFNALKLYFSKRI
ncbi:MAG: hypothetical protein ACWA41_05625 [Putridiphycobacter sp.]